MDLLQVYLIKDLELNYLGALDPQLSWSVLWLAPERVDIPYLKKAAQA